jgi:excisionase family DNA binding protein
VSIKKDSPTTELLNLPDAGALLGLTVWQLRGLISNRVIPVVQVGRKFYLRRATLVRWAERAEGLVRS